MIFFQTYGPVVEIASILLVMSLPWIVLRLMDRIDSLLGRTGSAVLARMMAVCYAAIAIQFILAGIQFCYPPG